MSRPESDAGCLSFMFRRRPLTRRKRASSASGEHLPKSQIFDGTSILNNANSTKSEETLTHFSPYCNLMISDTANWGHDDDVPLCAPREPTGPLPSPGVMETIERKLEGLNPELRILSMKLHAHPEIMFEEKYAHDLLSGYMASHGFTVTRHYLGLATAWRAEWEQGKGGRVLGVNSEMDALSGIGHACGHNLIAICGVGVAIAVKAALEAHGVSGKIILLGTPAEEGGGGKVILLERGAYKEMDVCLMSHPGPGPAHSTSSGTCVAMQAIEVEYFGRTAHAGAAPWEGTNALDAAFMAYSGIAVLRQQMKPDHRVHGVIEGRNWAPNVIPDYAKLRWCVRAPTAPELAVFFERVKACFEAAALATSCEIKVVIDRPYYELHQNDALAKQYADIVGPRYGLLTGSIGTSASTDFGNVSHEMPSLHPFFAIPTKPQGGNHTPAFAESAATPEAHAATLAITKGLAITGFRVLEDWAFYKEVKAAFKPSTI